MPSVLPCPPDLTASSWAFPMIRSDDYHNSLVSEIVLEIFDFFYLFSFHRLVVLWPLSKGTMNNTNQFPMHHYLQTLFFFPFSALEVTGGAFDFFIALGMLPLKTLFSVHRTKLSKIGFALSAFYNNTMHANK